MKKTLLFSAVLLFSAATFAQTSVKSTAAIKGQSSLQSDNRGTNANVSTNASSSSTIHSGVVKNTENRSSEEIKKEHKAVIAEKQAVGTEAKEGSKKSEKIASNDVAVSAYSNTEANTSAKNNSLNNNSSVKSTETHSASRAKSKSGAVKNQEKAKIKTATGATVKSANHVKSNEASTSAVQRGTVHGIKVKPLSIKTRAQINTNSGIKIK